MRWSVVMDPFSAFLTVLMTGSQVKPVSLPTSAPTATLVAQDFPGGGGGSTSAPPRLSVHIRGAGSQLACSQRGRMALMSTGATNITGDDTAFWGNYSGTRALVWCRPNGEVVLVSAGPGGLSEQVINALKEQF